jgi:hypothetical protein
MNDNLQFLKNTKNVGLITFLILISILVYLKLKNIDPKILSYFVAYLIVYLSNFLKLFIKSKIDKSEFNFYQTFLISTDVFFIAFGIVISQAIHLKNSDGQTSILLISIVTFIICIVFEIVESETKKFIFNLFFILILIFSTIYMTLELRTSEYFNRSEGESNTSKYEVFIPYKDFSISKHIGESKFNNKSLLYKKNVKANDKKDAKDSAIIWFHKEVKPLFLIKNKDTINMIEMSIDDIYIKD